TGDRSLRFAHLNHRQMSRVDIAHLIAFPSGYHAGEGLASVMSLPQISVQLFQNLRQARFAVDDPGQTPAHFGDITDSVDPSSVEVAQDEERAAPRLENLKIIAAGLGSRPVLGRDPDLWQIDDRRRHEELMRLQNQVEFLLFRPERERLFDRLAGYI